MYATIFIISTILTTTAAWGVKDDVLISMCRANCVHRLPASSQEYTSCWETCRKVHYNHHENGHLCRTAEFHPGQHLACSYLEAHSTDDAIYTEKLQLTATLNIQDDSTLIAEWLRPATDATDLVYLVLWTDDNNKWWHHITDTTQLHHVIERPAHFLYKNLQHRILAVGIDGVVAEVYLSYPDGQSTPELADGMVMDVSVTQKPVKPSTISTQPSTTLSSTSATTASQTTQTPEAVPAAAARYFYQLPSSSQSPHPLTVVLISACVSLVCAILGTLAALACSLACKHKKSTAPAHHFVWTHTLVLFRANTSSKKRWLWRVSVAFIFFVGFLESTRFDPSPQPFVVFVAQQYAQFLLFNLAWHMYSNWLYL